MNQSLQPVVVAVTVDHCHTVLVAVDPPPAEVQGAVVVATEVITLVAPPVVMVDTMV